MKKLKKEGLHILYLMSLTLLIVYFKWAGQETTTLPGLPAPESDSFVEILHTNTDLIIVSFIGSIPVFYLSLLYLTPTLLFKRSNTKIALYVVSLAAHYVAVILITGYIFPMYYFFGTPYAIKILIPVILISGVGGTVFAFADKYYEKGL